MLRKILALEPRLALTVPEREARTYAQADLKNFNEI